MQKLKQAIKRFFPSLVYRYQLSPRAKQDLLEKVKEMEELGDSPLPPWHDIFTDRGEDGIIHFLLKYLEPVNPIFVDIGAGDCINGNCTTLVTHFNWRGLFLDSDPAQLAVGRNFYKQKIKMGAAINIVQEEVTPANINTILEREGITGEIGLLSIDIDGNDYWIWKAIDKINPKLVVIEAKVEFGTRDVVVPYGPGNHHSRDKMYNGASVEALRKLGEQKGYDLVASNLFGYNLFFTRKEAGIPAIELRQILNVPHTRNSFYPDSFFTTHVFESI